MLFGSSRKIIYLLKRPCHMDDRSRYLRSLIYEMVRKERRGHIGPALSLVEILRVLFDNFLTYRPEIQIGLDEIDLF